MEPVFNNTRRTKKQGGTRTRGCILRAAFAVVNNAFQETAVCIPRKERKRNKLETLESQEKTEILYAQVFLQTRAAHVVRGSAARCATIYQQSRGTAY